MSDRKYDVIYPHIYINSRTLGTPNNKEAPFIFVDRADINPIRDESGVTSLTFTFNYSKRCEPKILITQDIIVHLHLLNRYRALKSLDKRVTRPFFKKSVDIHIFVHQLDCTHISKTVTFKFKPEEIELPELCTSKQQTHLFYTTLKQPQHNISLTVNTYLHLCNTPSLTLTV